MDSDDQRGLFLEAVAEFEKCVRHALDQDDHLHVLHEAVQWAKVIDALRNL